jgi:hypothetical protein
MAVKVTEIHPKVVQPAEDKHEGECSKREWWILAAIGLVLLMSAVVVVLWR